MITRFYVDNYKSLVNFEYKPKPMELIIGDNGSGKTTVFEALDKLRQFLNERANIEGTFPRESFTKWSTKKSQVFEIEFNTEIGKFKYFIEVSNSPVASYVEKEVATHEEEIMIESVWRRVESHSVFNDPERFSNHLNESRFVRMKNEQGDHEFPMSNRNESIIEWLPFAILSNFVFLKINPPLVTSKIGKVEPRLSRSGDNFGSYYLYTLQQKQGRMFDVVSHLREVLPGFDSFSVEENFEEGRRELNVNFKNIGDAKTKKTGETKFSFDELSDGQRALIVLYTLVLCELDAGKTIVIDEPENYIGLKELQPLILLMEERVRETGGQILLISHNQEFINMLTDRGVCTRFYRENNGHTRIAAFNPDSELTAAEVVARGWEDDEQ